MFDFPVDDPHLAGGAQPVTAGMRQIDAGAQARVQDRLTLLDLDALAQRLNGQALSARLGQWLNQHYGPASAPYQAIKHACETGVQAGWLAQYEGSGLRYGRIFKPADDLQGFSVDVVDMNNVAGPHHVHPEGEIDLIMPQDGDALFDGTPAGWLVCPPGSAHAPTVTQGRALVLYLLPQGRIEFTTASA